MIEAIKRQADMFCLALPNHTFPAKENLAAKLLDLAPPGFDRVFFTLGGSEAVENALKMARMVTGRYKTVSRYRSYHGSSMGAVSLSGDSRRPPVEPGLVGALHALDCYCYRCPFGHPPGKPHLACAEQFDTILGLDGSVGAVFLEPVPGANGVLIPSEGYWRRVRQLCDKHGALLVADEVLTGFGRTGRWLGIDHEDVVPDMITMAKGITGGYVPLGAVLVHERVSRHFDEAKLYCGLTYYGHPLACAAGSEALDIYREEGLVERAAAHEDLFRQGLREIAARAGQPDHDVRVRGLLGAVEWRDGLTPAFSPFFAALAQRLNQERIHAFTKPDTGMLILAPPLVTTSAELEEGLARIADCVSFAAKSLA
jgi:taurine--2-oxoglutarate transaminase